MEVTETLYVHTRDQWRSWLKENYKSKKEIWLVSYRKESGKPSLSYNAAVEEALCFDWIDSIRKGIDKHSYAQRYTPRKSGSSYSQTNKERLARLGAEGKLISEVEIKLEENRPEDYEIPWDILSALQANKDAWGFFTSTSASYQRIRAAYVDGARKRPEEFRKRLEHLIVMCASGKQFGYHIEDYY
jgi:uncharacterized protein YdeI (YjbR/CyaY-like superfamily)